MQGDTGKSKSDLFDQKRITDTAYNGIAEGGRNKHRHLSTSLVVGMNQAKGGQSDGKFNKSEDDYPCTEGGFIAMANQDNVNKQGTDGGILLKLPGVQRDMFGGTPIQCKGIPMRRRYVDEETARRVGY